MIITVFGANGAIGRLFVQQALFAGHHLNLYTRNKEGLPVSASVTIIVGELSEYEKIRQVIKGADAVVSLLGPPLKFWYKGMPITTGHQNIVRAMKAEGVTRLITIGTPSIKFEKDRRSMATVVPGILAQIIFPKPYREIVAIGKLVKSSGLDWTIVRFIAPVNGEPKGNVKITFGDQKIDFSITRIAIARFILEELAQNNYVHSMPIIGS